MSNINRLLGLQGLFDDPDALMTLKKEIIDDTRYVVPGYQFDYYLHTFHNAVEFELCKDLNGEEKGIVSHFCGNLSRFLLFDHIISEDGLTHLYAMREKDGKEVFTVRIVNPDILAFPKQGDLIYGQLEAFALGQATMENESAEQMESYFRASDDGSVAIGGFIECCDEFSFEFQGFRTDYYEITIDTPFDSIPVVVLKDNIKDPEVDRFINVDAVLSFDVAIDPDIGDRSYIPEPALYSDNYKHAAFENDRPFSQGFIPNRRVAERLLVGCIESGNYVRVNRGCAPTVCVKNGNVTTIVENTKIKDVFASAIPFSVTECQVMHLLTCPDQDRVGWNSIAVYSGDQITTVMTIDVNEYGFISDIRFFDPSFCELGFDEELHAIAMLSAGVCRENADSLRDYLHNKCYYHSEYADQTFIGATSIIDHLNEVAGNLQEQNKYSAKIIPASDVLRSHENLPEIFRGKWCSVTYQGGNLAYVVFIKLNDKGKISMVRLSRNGRFLNLFEEEHEKREQLNAVSLKTILEDFYGQENTLTAMRENETPEEEENDVYAWKEADAFTQSWLEDCGYEVSDAVIQENCIGYLCTEKEKPAIVYMFAYGSHKKTELHTADFLSIKEYPISQDRTIIILCLRVDKEKTEGGEEQYRVGSCYNSAKNPEFWTLKEVQGKDIVLYYPSSDIRNMNTRLMAAFNSGNLDVLKAIFSPDVKIKDYKDRIVRDGRVFSHLQFLKRRYDKMKIAYVRTGGLVYSLLPYLEGCCYISFNLSYGTNRIYSIYEKSVEENIRDLIITDESIEENPLNEYPLLKGIEFLPPSDIARFSVKLVFENGETRRYNFKEDSFIDGDEPSAEKNAYEEIVLISGICFTDKIFQNGAIFDPLAVPTNNNTPQLKELGQGITFVNGYRISTAELYFNSYPIGEFSYAGMDGVFIPQFDYEEDGYAVGRIQNMDPENPYYLLNRNTMTAKVLPKAYQNTNIHIYPFCGGYSEGRIMVNVLGELDLQYHHNRGICAGLWGWLDKNLNEIISPQFIFALNFNGGRAIVCKGEWTVNENNRYWCEHEQWGVIDLNGQEIVPCQFDELYEVDNTDRLYFVHTGGWNDGQYSIYDVEKQQILLTLDFDFDIGYMFNECFVTDKGFLVFDEHLPGEGKDIITVYDLQEKKILLYREDHTGRTFNGESSLTVKNESTGMDIVVF